MIVSFSCLLANLTLQKYKKKSIYALFFIYVVFYCYFCTLLDVMIELLLGIVCGIALSLFFSFGPSFFTQVRTSIQYGFKKSYPFAFGISAGDVIIVFLMLTVLKNADLYSLVHNVWVASVGGGVMILMAVYFFRKEVTSLEGYEGKEPHIKFRSKDGEPRRRSIFLQGFLINFINPTIWIYWISVITLITGELNMSVLERYEFFFGVMAATLGMDIMKCKLASMLQRIMTAKVLNITNKICAIILFCFAAYLIISMIVYQTSPAKDNPVVAQKPKSTEMIKTIHDKMDSSIIKGHNAADTVMFKLKHPKKHIHK